MPSSDFISSTNKETENSHRKHKNNTEVPKYLQPNRHEINVFFYFLFHLSKISTNIEIWF